MNDKKKFSFEYRATFLSDIDNSIKIWFAKPFDDSYQKIEKVTFSHKPKRIYLDKKGNDIVYFELSGASRHDLKINIIASITKRLFCNKRKKTIIGEKLYNQRFLESEKYLEQSNEIIDLTLNITKKAKSTEDKLKMLFEYIVSNFQYRYPVKHRGVSCLDLNSLKGDCAEYSSLFVTMCRILKIPARNETGFVLFPEQKKILEHAWSSVYLEKKGWVDMDTQYASIESRRVGFKKYFAKRSDYRLNFVHGFNISLKPILLREYDIKHNTNVILPLYKSTVQTLQPLIFISKKKLKFNHRISYL